MAAQIDTIIVICSCYRPVEIPIVHGKKVNSLCACGNYVTYTFPHRKFTSRWQALEVDD